MEFFIPIYIWFRFMKIIPVNLQLKNYKIHALDVWKIKKKTKSIKISVYNI